MTDDELLLAALRGEQDELGSRWDSGLGPSDMETVKLAGLRALRRAIALEAVGVVHDHFHDAALCEPVEAALERHFGFTEAPSIQ